MLTHTVMFCAALVRRRAVSMQEATRGFVAPGLWQVVAMRLSCWRTGAAR